MAIASYKGIVYASITAVFWGFLAIFLKMAMAFIDPINLTWFRFLFSFIALAIFYLISDPSKFKIFIRPPLLLVIAALGLSINFVAFLYGVQYTSPSSAQVIIQIGPILLGMVGFVFYKEKINVRQGAGYVIAGAGLFIFYQDNISKLIGNEADYNMGIVWIIIAALSWVVYAALQKTLVKSFPVHQLNMFLFSLPVLLFLPFMHFSAFTNLTLPQWMLLIYLGISTILPYAFVALAFKYLEASKTSIIITTNPLITFAAIALLNYYQIYWIPAEHYSFIEILAGVIVITGVIFAIVSSNKARDSR